jgi:hypothetical protein
MGNLSVLINVLKVLEKIEAIDFSVVFLQAADSIIAMRI